MSLAGIGLVNILMGMVVAFEVLIIFAVGIYHYKKKKRRRKRVNNLSKIGKTSEW